MAMNPGIPNTWMNDLTAEQAERCRERARELCTCGGAAMALAVWWASPTGHRRRELAIVSGAR